MPGKCRSRWLLFAAGNSVGGWPSDLGRRAAPLQGHLPVEGDDTPALASAIDHPKNALGVPAASASRGNAASGQFRAGHA